MNRNEKLYDIIQEIKQLVGVMGEFFELLAHSKTLDDLKCFVTGDVEHSFDVMTFESVSSGNHLNRG